MNSVCSPIGSTTGGPAGLWVCFFGSVPFFLLLVPVAFRNGMLLLRSQDPIRLCLARAVLAGLIWAFSENYLLYLGNAASILVFFSLFLNERLGQLEHHYRLLARRQQWRQWVLSRSASRPGSPALGTV